MKTSQAKAKVVIVDDHPLLRDGLMQLVCSQPDLQCAGVADETAGARRLVEQFNPDLMLLDLRLKGGDALDLIKSLRAEHPSLKVLVLSQYDESVFAERVLRAGACGYVMKENATDEILNAVRTVLAGDMYISERIRSNLVRRALEKRPAPAKAGVEQLSDRELQVFQLIGAAFSSREIAGQFHVSVKTIETHRENIKSKLGIQSSAQLSEFARNWTQQNLLPRVGYGETDAQGGSATTPPDRH